ncbi:MAG: hypothetical protein ABSC04_08690 [Syntrophobacteraceae bacterium]|jgi:hypothetical protein
MIEHYRGSKSSVQQSRVADKVQIRKESLDKAEQLKKSEQIAQGLSYNPGGRKIRASIIFPDQNTDLSNESDYAGEKYENQNIQIILLNERGLNPAI